MYIHTVLVDAWFVQVFCMTTMNANNIIACIVQLLLDHITNGTAYMHSNLTTVNKLQCLGWAII